MQLLETVEEMARDCENLYGPRGWQKALRVAVHIVEQGGMVYTNVRPEQSDGAARMMAEYIARGDAYNMVDPMVAYGYYAADNEGREWIGKPQKVQSIAEDEE